MKTIISICMLVAVFISPENVLAAPKRTVSHPTYLETQVRKTMSLIKSRPLRSYSASMKIEEGGALSKNDWLRSIYRHDIVQKGEPETLLSDKRIFSGVVKAEMGEGATKFIPKTLGLKEFLIRHKLVNGKGRIVASGKAIDEALHSEFPSGFVARPAVGVAPNERGRGLYKDSEQFIVALLDRKSKIYHPSHLMQPVRSHILGRSASGEAIVLQEDIVASADARKPLKSRYFQEVRIHTYENKVVVGAIPQRWVQADLLTPADEERAAAFVSEFLASLPLSVLNRQAWGVDVAVLDNGELRINDVVTNRGQSIGWSSYLEQPKVIAAYTKHFEAHTPLAFTGLTAALTRNGFANYFPYWGKRIEKAKPGLGKALAYFPPMP